MILFAVVFMLGGATFIALDWYVGVRAVNVVALLMLGSVAIAQGVELMLMTRHRHLYDEVIHRWRDRRTGRFARPPR